MILQEEFQSHANYHFSQWSVSAEQLLFCWLNLMQLSLNSYILLCMLLHCCMDPRYTHQFQYGSPCPPIQPHKGRHSRSLDPAELSKEILHSVCMEHCIISNLHNKSHCSCKGWIGIHRSQFHSVVRSSLVHTHRCSPLANSIKHRLNYAPLANRIAHTLHWRARPTIV